VIVDTDERPVEGFTVATFRPVSVQVIGHTDQKVAEQVESCQISRELERPADDSVLSPIWMQHELRKDAALEHLCDKLKPALEGVSVSG